MAMNGNQLGQEIAAAIMNSAAPPEVQQQVISLWQKIGTAIVSHIATNGSVKPGIAVATTGTAAAQTGSTTAAGVIE